MVIWSEFRTWQYRDEKGIPLGLSNLDTKCVDNKFEMLVTEAIAEDKRQAQKS